MTPAELRCRCFGHALHLRRSEEPVEVTAARAEKILAWCLAGQPAAETPGSGQAPAPVQQSRAAEPAGRSGAVTQAVRQGRA